VAESLNNSDALHAARRVADHAVRTGVLGSHVSCRPVYQHIGAVLADSVLQAGLNYAKVVKPRIATILRTFPHATTMNILIGVIEQEGSPKFLQWEHREKVSRFDNLVGFMAEAEIDSTSELSRALRDKSFRMDIRQVRGVGPKTVDYMACLVGVDCIATSGALLSSRDWRTTATIISAKCLVLRRTCYPSLDVNSMRVSGAISQNKPLDNYHLSSCSSTWCLRMHTRLKPLL
jgi:hypothetical protein